MLTQYILCKMVHLKCKMVHLYHDHYSDDLETTTTGFTTKWYTENGIKLQWKILLRAHLFCMPVLSFIELYPSIYWIRCFANGFFFFAWSGDNSLSSQLIQAASLNCITYLLFPWHCTDNNYLSVYNITTFSL